MILHVVLYQPRESATQEDRAALAASLETVSREVPSIRQVRVGRTINLGLGYENRSSGQEFDFIALFEFNNENDLRSYMAHPKHAELAELFWKVCDRTMILDLSAVNPMAGETLDELVK